MSDSRSFLWIVMIPLIPVLPRATFGGAPVVSNVVAVQRTTMGGEVDITYDLTDTDGDACTITVEIITPEGAIIRPQLLSGHAGTGVTPGTGKHIVWDAMRDQPGRYGTTWRARVLANDGHLGEEIQYNLPGSSVPLTFVHIPSGEFSMGATFGADTHPIHTVYLDEYWISKYEITVAQWRVFAAANGLSMPSSSGVYSNYTSDPQYDNYPVVNVSWTECQAFADWAGVALPTEAQWEKAARGTDERTYPWGNEDPWADNIYRANITGTEDGHEYTSPVGAYGLGASPYGVFDMAGNVLEWCRDWYDIAYYSQTPTGGWNNTLGPLSGTFRATRGGSWFYNLAYARSAARYIFLSPPETNPSIGFRVVRPQ